MARHWQLSTEAVDYFGHFWRGTASSLNIGWVLKFWAFPKSALCAVCSRAYPTTPGASNADPTNTC